MLNPHLFTSINPSWTLRPARCAPGTATTRAAWPTAAPTAASTPRTPGSWGGSACSRWMVPAWRQGRQSPPRWPARWAGREGRREPFLKAAHGGAQRPTQPGVAMGRQSPGWEVTRMHTPRPLPGSDPTVPRSAPDRHTTMQSVGRAQGGGLRRGVRIVPTWAPAVDPLFLGYRTRHGGDATLPDGAANKLSVYTAAIKGADDARMTTWEGALAGEPAAGVVASSTRASVVRRRSASASTTQHRPALLVLLHAVRQPLRIHLPPPLLSPAAGESWTHPTAGLVVRFRSVVNGTTAVVSVCRKGGVETLQSCQANRDMDCNGLAGALPHCCTVVAVVLFMGLLLPPSSPQLLLLPPMRACHPPPTHSWQASTTVPARPYSKGGGRRRKRRQSLCWQRGVRLRSRTQPARRTLPRAPAGTAGAAAPCHALLTPPAPLRLALRAAPAPFAFYAPHHHTHMRGRCADTHCTAGPVLPPHPTPATPSVHVHFICFALSAPPPLHIHSSVTALSLRHLSPCMHILPCMSATVSTRYIAVVCYHPHHSYHPPTHPHTHSPTHSVLTHPLITSFHCTPPTYSFI